MWTHKFCLGELFCGPGGMAIASTRVGPVRSLDHTTYTLEHAWGVDFSPPAIDTFNANLGGGICMDAWEFVKKHLDEKHRINAQVETDGVFAYQSGSDIIVSGEGELQVFDVMGRMVMNQYINGVQTVEKPSITGVYIFRLNEKSQKIVVR